jgi:hypothetical protein
MMKHEFTVLTGVRVTDNEYAAIEKQYMESELDKVAWCKKWKNGVGYRMLLTQRYEKICALEASAIHPDEIRELAKLAEYWEDRAYTLEVKLETLESERDSLKQQLAKAKCECDELKRQTEHLERGERRRTNEGM